MIDPNIEMEVSPDKYSRCEICSYYIKDRSCWMQDYICTYMWNNYDDPKEFNCEYFKSIINGKLNSHYIFPDFEDRDRFPEKKFGQGKYRFDKFGNIIGELK
jgi:hypothetical protein